MACVSTTIIKANSLAPAADERGTVKSICRFNLKSMWPFSFTDFFSHAIGPVSRFLACGTIHNGFV